MDLGFHAPYNDDKWCCCPFSTVTNKKCHALMDFHSECHPHLNEQHNGILRHGVIMYLQTLYRDVFGVGELILNNSGKHLDMLLTLVNFCFSKIHETSSGKKPYALL